MQVQQERTRRAASVTCCSVSTLSILATLAAFLSTSWILWSWILDKPCSWEPMSLMPISMEVSACTVFTWMSKILTNNGTQVVPVSAKVYFLFFLLSVHWLSRLPSHTTFLFFLSFPSRLYRVYGLLRQHSKSWPYTKIYRRQHSLWNA